ncbi:MAG: protein translocase subunit SecF [bacterium]|nr:protein translocase subunit SecF [bacterium]
MDIFRNTNINFLAKRKFAYILSMIVILAGLFSLISKGGPKLGIDFTGGTLVQLNFGEIAIENDEVRTGLESMGFENIAIQRFTGSNIMIFRIPATDQLANSKINELQTYINKDFVIEKVEIVGPAVGKWLVKRALLAFCLAFLGIIIYIAIRFHAGIWGLAGVMALVHDILVTVGIFSLLGKEITLPVVAALMTIVGYSINDTIVIYDRIRENIRIRYKDPLDVVVNDSINQTLSRTVITTVLTLFSAFALFLFGGDILRDFSLVLIIGMISGVYSTIFVASPVVYDVKNKKTK